MGPPFDGSIILGDVQRILSCLPDDHVDLVVADPGYGMDKASWDDGPDYGPWLREVRRVLKPGGTAYIFGRPEVVAALWGAFPGPKRLLTWQVSNRTTPGCRTWQPTQETIVMLWKGQRPHFDREAVREAYTPGYERQRGRPRPPTPGRFGNRATAYSRAPGALPRDVLRGPGLSGRVGAREGLGHPCQKPLWLLERLIKASCPPGGLVLDLFAGTATASVAAHRLGRKWIAVEKDPHWCQIARERLRGEGAAAEVVQFRSPAERLSAVEAELAALKAQVQDVSRSPGGADPGQVGDVSI